MVAKRSSASRIEQDICKSCGFCCDGTLFRHASLNPGEKGSLPEMIEQRTFSEGEKDYFRLPCRYFSRICSIYTVKRANVCASYRCQLLKDIAVNKLTKKAALKIIEEASHLRDEIFNEFYNLSEKQEVLFFKELTELIIKIIESDKSDKKFRTRYELLLGKCNILEALLIKHIRSTEDFKDLMA